MVQFEVLLPYLLFPQNHIKNRTSVLKKFSCCTPLPKHLYTIKLIDKNFFRLCLLLPPFIHFYDLRSLLFRSHIWWNTIGCITIWDLFVGTSDCKLAFFPMQKGKFIHSHLGWNENDFDWNGSITFVQIKGRFFWPSFTCLKHISGDNEVITGLSNYLYPY